MLGDMFYYRRLAFNVIMLKKHYKTLVRDRKGPPVLALTIVLINELSAGGPFPLRPHTVDIIIHGNYTSNNFSHIGRYWCILCFDSYLR